MGAAVSVLLALIARIDFLSIRNGFPPNLRLVLKIFVRFRRFSLPLI